MKKNKSNQLKGKQKKKKMKISSSTKCVFKQALWLWLYHQSVEAEEIALEGRAGNVKCCQLRK